MFSAADYHYMARAIRLAERGLYTTDPNPRVGCVIVQSDQIVGQAWHRKAGEAHAERLALTEAQEKARGATAYVSLEPCCHQGKTPPCTSALLAAGIRRVVVAMPDPNPLVAGQGIALLRQNGVQVEVGLLASEAEKLNPGFIKRMTQNQPYLRCKLAMSLDGRTAMADGESRWISSAASRQRVHQIRARSSAILTGIGTVLADDPRFNCRLPLSHLVGVEYAKDLNQPVRVVLDRQLRFPLNAQMLRLSGRTWIMHSSTDQNKIAALQKAGAELFYFQSLHLKSVLRFLAQKECNEVLLESGPTLAGSALKSGLFDELILYVAPHLMGDQAKGLFHLPEIQHMADRIQLQFISVRPVGPDLECVLKCLPASSNLSVQSKD